MELEIAAGCAIKRGDVPTDIGGVNNEDMMGLEMDIGTG